MSNQTTKVTVEQKEFHLQFTRYTDRYNWSSGVNLAQEAKRPRSEQELRTLTALLYDIPEEKVEVTTLPAKPTVLIKVRNDGGHYCLTTESRRGHSDPDWDVGHRNTVTVPLYNYTDDQFKAIVRAMLVRTEFPFDEAEVTVERVP